MKTFILFFMLILSTTIARADIVVVYDPNTKEVDSLSAINDAVIPAGYVSKTIPGNPEEYYASADAKDYKFNGNKLSLNVKKVNDRETEKQQRKAAKQADKDSAINKLKTLGLTDAEINALTGR